MTGNIQDWLERRAVLNHDVLCNQLRTELASLVENTAANPVRLAQWLGREPEYVALFRDAAAVLDPANLIDGASFNVWSDDRRASVRAAVSDVFMHTSPVVDELAALRTLLQQCIEVAEAFLATPASSRTRADAVRMQVLFERLSDGISRLPKRCGGPLLRSER